MGRPKQARDEVDQLVDDWRRERPEVDVSPLEILSRVTRLARHLDRVRKQAFASQDLEQWGFDVLAALRRAGAPYELAPGALLQATLVTSGAMTNRLGRLEVAGLVARRPDPTDGRGVIVKLTPAGKRRVDKCLSLLLESEQALIKSLPAEDRHVLAGLLRDVLLPLDTGTGA
ncbi:MAG TPA: MarR family transcriptional regulator [Acidimicrobiales bacterium]|jgi:DNA-binding MarR family transcriptional regulator|nr:MarR family transcriptional regulator [Acidimicrobiales bacterium]